MKFEDLKIGMKLKANEKSNIHYTITNNKNEWQGVVTKIDKKRNFFNAITTKTIDNSYINSRFSLDPKYFEPIEEEKPKKKIVTMSEIPLKVVRDRNTICVFYKDKKVAQATCSPEDTFNEEFGLNLALRRFCAGLADTNEKIVKTVDHVEDFI